MFGSIKKILGLVEEADYHELVSHGATIIDVRSKREYSVAHIEDSINIPINRLKDHLSKFKGKDEDIICCCGSGIRSRKAKKIFEDNGYRSVYNGGSWNKLQKKI